MRKPENTFILSVHKFFLHKEVPHREKMNNPYSSGTADVWYSGCKGDLWVEYKFIPKLPVRSTTVVADCSPLQLKWLRGRYEEGRMVYVVIGTPSGGVILTDLEWENPVLITDFNNRLISRSALAEWISNTVLGGQNERSRTPRHLRGPRKTVT